MVTIIIPTYKRANCIDRAIQSILNQTYKDFEIIVVDDNDPDTEYRKDLEKKMQKYEEDQRVIYIQHEKNKNGAAARNTGIKIAKGEYITFLDDDDYFLSKRLEVLINALENNKEYDCAYSNNLITKNKKIIGHNLATKSGQMKKELLLGTFSFGSGSNMFFRASAIHNLNGFDESFLRHQDIETMIRFFNIGKLLAVDEYLLVKVQDDRSNEPNIEKYIKVKENYFNAFKSEIDNLNENDKNNFYKNNYMQLACKAVREKDKAYYKKFLSKAKEFGSITMKEKIKIMLLKVNNYIKIEKIKYIVNKIKLNMKIDKSIKEEIINYENI